MQFFILKVNIVGSSTAFVVSRTLTGHSDIQLELVIFEIQSLRD